MNTLLKKSAVAVSLALASVGAHAFTNLGFETGSFSSWTVAGAGAAAVISTTASAGLPEVGSDMWSGVVGGGNYMAALRSGSTVELAFQAGLLSTPMTLWMNFITSEAPSAFFNDAITASISLAGGGNVTYFLDTANVSSQGSSHTQNSSAWHSFLIPVNAVSLNLSLTNGGDQLFQSYGLVDITTAVPEPETYAMLLAGLGLMGFVARRRQRKLAAA